ncbi:MAG: transposase [Anaerolineae bacterium]|nr:transposase [Anaerolineae bacterium]
MRTTWQGFMYRIDPNRTQQTALAVQFGHARYVYNWGLAERRAAYETTGKGLTYNQQAKRLTALKREQPWLREAHSQVLQQKLMDLNDAYQQFFDRVKKGTKPAGYPRFKRRKGDQKIRYPQGLEIVENRIKLPKVGWVKIRLHRPFEGEMKSCTVTKTKSGAYFVSILCEVEVPEVAITGPTVGIDLGLITLATFSNDEPPAPNHRFLRQSEHKLKQLQRKLARQKQNSRQWLRTKRRIAALQEHIANQRQDQQHRLSFYLTRHYGRLVFENLHIKGMLKNHRLAKSISDTAWSQFVEFCEYKGEWYGCAVERVDRFFPSTQKCHVCGVKNKDLDLSDRQWQCPNCKTVLDRDKNAAINMLLAGGG